MTVSYSTDGEGGVYAIGPYLVSSGGKSRLVDVGEEDVLRGGEIAVDF